MRRIDFSSLEHLTKLSEVGIALSAEKDNNRLLELILRSARELTNADGGTLYSVTPEARLNFEIVFNRSLGVHMGGTSGVPIEFEQIPLQSALIEQFDHRDA